MLGHTKVFIHTPADRPNLLKLQEGRVSLHKEGQLLLRKEVPNMGMVTEDFRLLISDPFMKLISACAYVWPWKLPLHLKPKLAGNCCVRLNDCAFVYGTARQLRDINGEGAHRALSHQCACAEN